MRTDLHSFILHRDGSRSMGYNVRGRSTIHIEDLKTMYEEKRLIYWELSSTADIPNRYKGDRRQLGSVGELVRCLGSLLYIQFPHELEFFRSNTNPILACKSLILILIKWNETSCRDIFCVLCNFTVDGVVRG